MRIFPDIRETLLSQIPGFDIQVTASLHLAGMRNEAIVNSGQTAASM
jgi:hypothetical protein